MRPERTPHEGAVSERELVERAGRGDHDAFAVLLHESIGRLEAVARLVLRDQDLARDAVQDAFIRAWRDLPGLRDPDRFDAWMHRLTVAASLGIPLGTAQSRLGRALVALRAAMTVDAEADRVPMPRGQSA